MIKHFGHGQRDRRGGAARRGVIVDGHCRCAATAKSSEIAEKSTSNVVTNKLRDIVTTQASTQRKVEDRAGDSQRTLLMKTRGL